ncbi:MAG: hypothetical protein A2751_04365 [Candidatus Doudnabacteria bacterium RIFCSPHIGHO2_01_FULL_46_14]|uniref:Glycosyltransferase RgtA/B/C/D-like domain-containing protein n=1 Tax=Candidatus Doudnabacteria bacterium RIFCSPHIGHO2_01_FULL_46_14 TaxID=1817824 RepID=A0A1F5NNE3_9BACT|nr:MAG: hypothetical protein A2751_04365 [Candidatus Doudnabacteria bacterium RIFCSPHIGHO2_01_FULL_46_14]
MIYIILIVSALLRFYNNTAVALWHDEAFSALYIRYPLGEMIQRIILDVHPPLYYLVLRLWAMFAGNSLFSLRLLSIIFGVLTVWAGYMFVKTAFSAQGRSASGGGKLPLVAAFLLAINPFQIQYALEARMYTLGTFLILLASYFLVKALVRDVHSTRKKYWVGFTLAVAGCLYTHYYLVFSVAALGLYILFDVFTTRRFKNLLPAVLSALAVTVLYIPWLKSFFEQASRVQASYWIPAMDRWSVPGTIWKMVFGGQGIRPLVLVIASVVTLAIIVYFLRRVHSQEKWLVFLALAVPFLAAVLISMKSNLYLDRYFVFASLYFTILIAAALYKLPNFFLRWGALILLSVAILFAFFKNWELLNIHNSPGMAAASEVINLQAQKNDKIIVGSSFIYFTFKYYNETLIAPQLISDRPIKDIPHFSGTAILTDDDLILDLNKFAKGQEVWLLWTTGFGGSKPSLPRNWKQLSERKYADSPGFKGEIYVNKYEVN